MSVDCTGKDLIVGQMVGATAPEEFKHSICQALVTKITPKGCKVRFINPPKSNKSRWQDVQNDQFQRRSDQVIIIN